MTGGALGEASEKLKREICEKEARRMTEELLRRGDV